MITFQVSMEIQRKTAILWVVRCTACIGWQSTRNIWRIRSWETVPLHSKSTHVHTFLADQTLLSAHSGVQNHLLNYTFRCRKTHSDEFTLDSPQRSLTLHTPLIYKCFNSIERFDFKQLSKRHSCCCSPPFAYAFKFSCETSIDTKLMYCTVRRRREISFN